MVRTPTLLRRLTSPAEDTAGGSARPRTRSRVMDALGVEKRTPAPSAQRAVNRGRANTPSRIRSVENLEREMWTQCALTMRVQAAYMILLGIAIIVMPHQLCALVETLTLGWFHSDVSRPDLLDAQYGAITGFFYVYLGTFYFALARLEEFARYTLISRTVLVPGLNLALIVFGKQHPRLFLFSAVDIGLAAWTYSVLPPDLGPISIRT